MGKLTKEERDLIESLPKPPALGTIRVSNVWIIEWLRDDPHEIRSGRDLHLWMESIRPGWSTYRRCHSKEEVLAQIQSAVQFAKSGGIPILHLETHGGTAGLGDGSGDEILEWDELVGPLQELNLATRCNLLIFVAACTGFAGVMALASGPRAPAIALIGPADKLPADHLFVAAKKFYSTLIEPNPHFQAMAEESSDESGQWFEPESFVALAYESLVHQAIKGTRPAAVLARRKRIRSRLIQLGMPEDVATAKVQGMPLCDRDQAQEMWDRLFMIDRYVENGTRFALDVRGLIDQVTTWRSNNWI